MSKHAVEALPLSTLLTRSAPSHPLIQIIASPVLPRVALLEAIVLSHAGILRRAGLSPRTIVSVAVLALGTAVARFRIQWRAMLGLLGLTEAIVRSLKILESFDANAGLAQVESEHNQRQQHEIKHLLSFWIVYGLIALLEALRAPPTSATSVLAPRPFLARLAPVTRTFRALLQRIATGYPGFAFLAPTRRPQRRPFPQPRPRISDVPALPAQSLAAAYLSSEVKYRIVKLLVLWTALRQDGWGASFLWDWVLGPIAAVARKRAEEQGPDEEMGIGRPRRKKRVIRVIMTEEDEDGLITDKGDHEASPRQDVFAGEDSNSTATSPTYSRRSFASTREDTGEDLDGDEAGDASFASSSHHGSPFSHVSSTNPFPTPNVQFRLASSAHPIRGSAADYHAGITRFDSPTPASRMGSSVTDQLTEAPGDGHGW